MVEPEVLGRMGKCKIVPVVVLDTPEKAIPTAKALFAGGVDIMEITLRTPAGIDAIRLVARERPEICVGAGTVLTLDKCIEAVDAGAKFIVSPGFDKEIVSWCIERGIAVIPGCVTPTEITAAISYGLSVLKFFPNDVFGGLSAMKALNAPFGDIRFIPTGGISGKNLGEYALAPFIHAVGGSWLCTKQDIESGSFERITDLAAKAVGIMSGIERI